MAKLSIVTTGRHDDYEGDSLGRIKESLDYNCRNLTKYGFDFEYIISEWNNINEPLSRGPLKWLFDQYNNLHDVCISKSVVEAENLNVNRYFEYFAKNAGLRLATKDNVLLLNSDIIMSEELVEEIKSLLDKGLDSGKFYRARNRYQVKVGYDIEILETKDLHEPFLTDSHVCGSYSGDFLMTTRDKILEAGGYEESTNDVRAGYQTGLDGSCLFNMYHRGMRLEFVNGPYYHIKHEKNRRYDTMGYNQKGYQNPENWGFVKYPKKIDGNLTIIYHE